MKKLLNNPWAVGALALIAVAVGGKSLLPKHAAIAAPLGISNETGAVEQETPADLSAAPMSKVGVALKELAISATPRDPFSARIKLVAPTAAADKTSVPDSVDTLRLSAIWIQGANTFVLINGEIHQAGDEFSRFKIESATRDGVWVTHWKGRDFLSLGMDFTLTTPATRSTVAVAL